MGRVNQEVWRKELEEVQNFDLQTLSLMPRHNHGFFFFFILLPANLRGNLVFLVCSKKTTTTNPELDFINISDSIFIKKKIKYQHIWDLKEREHEIVAVLTITNPVPMQLVKK